jgi:ATP phosphoribosyltransferase
VDKLHFGSRDIGFAGADWVKEFDAQLVEVLDTGLNPVKLVAAAPSDLLIDGQLPQRRLVVASEYERLTQRWIQQRQLDAQLIRTFGATEVFPPEDADLIVDNSATGSTLAENNLEVVDELMCSSTRLYANPLAYNDSRKRQIIEDLSMLLQAVLEGRLRSMLEVNVSQECLEQVIEALPAMQRPTVSPLHGSSGFAVRAAVLRSELPRVIPRVKARGGRDIVVSNLNQIVP